MNVYQIIKIFYLLKYYQKIIIIMRTLRVKHAVTRLKNKIIGQSRIATQLQGPEQASLAKDFGVILSTAILYK